MRHLVNIMIKKFKEPLIRGGILVVCAIVSLFSLLEAGLKSGREEYFNQKPKITHLSSTSLKVEWNLYPQFSKTTHYQVQLNSSLYGFSTKETSKTVNKLQPGGTYRIAVVTYDNGTVAGVSSSTAIFMAPAAPTGITASQIGSASVELAWLGVNTATAYRIYLGSDTLLLEVNASETRAFITYLPDIFSAESRASQRPSRCFWAAESHQQRRVPAPVADRQSESASCEF